MSILLVDDQPARLLAYESILQDLGHDLVRAGSGLEALEKLMMRDYAVIVLDVSMPGMDGFETASLIHEHPRYERTPIIFASGVNVSELDRLKGYERGAVDYITIPIVPEILKGKVAVLVELYCKRRELELLNRALEQANTQLSTAHAALEAQATRELEAVNRDLRRANSELETINLALKSEVAERARIEQQLKEADRHKDEFLAMLAHELRNPLAPIRNAVHILQEKARGDAQLTWIGEVVDRQVGSLTRLVDDLLDVSRITRGKINIACEPLELGANVGRAVETVQPLMAEKRIEFTVEVDAADAAATIEGDLTRLTQSIGNILANAAKYTSPGGHIRICGRAVTGAVEVSVKDDGIGIPPAELARIFDLFTQLERAGERAPAGLGIGLALVRRLVELHGGTVTAASAGPGLGSEFIVRLPRRAELRAGPAAPANCEAPAMSGALAAPAARAREHVAAEPRRILVVDDNRDALESLAALLELAGHAVRAAGDGDHALALASSFRPEVVLLDIGLPKIDGYEVARRIRSQPWGESIQLIALTGWGQEDDRRRTREAGFDSHMVKPIELEALTGLLAHPRRRASPRR
ncbi:MAG: response regulator [Steroidobacteraceae bacterium]